MEQTFKTQGGTVLRIRPVTAFFMMEVAMNVEKAWIAKGEPIEVPTYTLTMVTGEKEVFSHKVTETENTLEVEGNPEQTRNNKLLWSRYTEALHRFDIAQTEAINDSLLMECVSSDEPETPGWEGRYTRHGIAIPSDIDERRVFYLKHEVLTTADFIKLCGILRTLAQGKVVTQELLDSMGRLFRGAVGTKDREAFIKFFDQLWSPVVGESEIPRTPDGTGVAPDAGPVGPGIRAE